MEFLNRFKEPSTWAGLAVLAQLVAPQLGIHGDVGGAATQIGAAIAAVAAVVRAEQATKVS